MEHNVSKQIAALTGKDVAVILEKKFSIPTGEGTGFLAMQGGGTDGTYGYFIMVTSGNSAVAMSTIYKIDLHTWEIVKTSKPLHMYHANDLAYDSKHHRLVVSHCDLVPDQVSIVDPDTVEIIEVKTIPQKHFSIAYNAQRGMYVVGKSKTYDLVLLNDDFDPVKLLPGEDGHIKQGLACDPEYIYFFQTGVRNNWIFVYDWDGGYWGKIRVPMVGESENLFEWNDGFIGAFNNTAEHSADIYIMKLTEKKG